MCVCVYVRACMHACVYYLPYTVLIQHDVYSGIPGEKLLSAVLDALSDPSTSYIGLNYDSAISLSAGKT